MTPQPLSALQVVALNAMSVDMAAVKVIARLREAGIRSLLIKGGALRVALYERPGETRRYGDIDLLVAPAQVEPAAAIMRAEGWTDSEFQSAIGHAHHMEPPETGLPFPLDIHRSFHHVGVSPGRVWDLLSAHAVQVDIAGRTVESLDPAGSAALVCLHLAGHGEATKVIEDVQRAVQRLPLDVWREAAALADDLRASAPFVAALRHVEGGATVADALGLSQEIEPALMLSLGGAPPTARLLLELRSAWPHPRALWRVLVTEAFPDAELMRAHYSLARRGRRWGLACAYAMRPFTLTPRLLSGWRAASVARECATTEHAGARRRRTGVAHRVHLAAEILWMYARVSRVVARTNVKIAVHSLRDRVVAGRSPASAAEADASHLARGVWRVLRWLPGDTRCLSQSLVLSALLARRGVSSRIVVAVRASGDNDFGAHAWVEIDGQTYLWPGAPGDAKLVEL